MAAALTGIRLPENAVELTRKALTDSFAEEKVYRNNKLRHLRAEHSKTIIKQDAAYEDKLAGNITSEFWERLSVKYTQERHELECQIRAHEVANDQYIVTGVKIIELAEKAGELYVHLTKEEKRDMLKLVLSNFSITGKSLCYTYKKPFDMFANSASWPEWLGCQDSNLGMTVPKTVALPLGYTPTIISGQTR